jgi:hypothetical protein
VGAPLIVAGTLLAICIAAIAAGRQSLRPPRHSARAHHLTGASLNHEASALFKDQKSALLLGALLAGIVAGSGKK